MIRQAYIYMFVSHVSLFQFGVWPIRLLKILCRCTIRAACVPNVERVQCSIVATRLGPMHVYSNVNV